MGDDNINTFRYSESADIILKVEDQRFYVEKEVLREKCPYFRAMFSGSFKENSQEEVVIEMTSSLSMKYILDYIYRDAIPAINIDNTPQFLSAVNYFQLQELQDIVIKKLISWIDCDNWLQIWKISKTCGFDELETKVRSYGLYQFKEVRDKIECLDSLSILHWYLSHESLNVHRESDVFKAGCRWLKHNNNNDGILVVLSCLSFKSLKVKCLEEMLKHDMVKKNELAIQVLKGFLYILKNGLDKNKLTEDFKSEFCLHFSEDVYEIIYGLTLNSKDRIPPVKPCFSGNWNRKGVGVFSYSLRTKQLENKIFLQLESWWGCHVVTWKSFNIIIIGGESIYTGSKWNSDIYMYNYIQDKWTILNSQPLPKRRHGAAVVYENTLYLVGGVGRYRVSLESVHRYDLLTDTWHVLPDLPEICQYPVATVHKNELYVLTEHIYVYRNNSWVLLHQIYPVRKCVFSYENYIYFPIKLYPRDLFRSDMSSTIFNYSPEDDILTKKTQHKIHAVCNINNIVYFFTRIQEDELCRSKKITLYIEKANLDDELQKAEVISCEMDRELPSAFSGFILPDLETEDRAMCTYGERWLK